MKNELWTEIGSEMFDELLDIADYIAYNNREFVCTACLTTLDKLKDFVHKFYGYEEYRYFSEVINSMLEDKDYED